VLSFRTFGAIDLRREDGERLKPLLRQPKRLALLAYLAAEQSSGPVRREQILPLLWSDSAPSDARHALSSTLSRLRGSLGSDVVRGSGEETLWLDPDHFEADVLTFQRALSEEREKRALEAYRGRFLEGFRISGARRFEEWIRERREQFHSRACEAGLEAGRRARSDGDLHAAERALRRTLELQPLNERALGLLLEILAERGERSEVLRVFRDYRERLDDELELSPSEELTAFVDRIRSEPQTSGVDPDAPDREDELDGGGVSTPGPPSGDAGDGTDGRSRDAASGIRPGPRLLAVSLLAALLLVGAGLWAWRQIAPVTESGKAGPRTAAPTHRTTLAVLPFELVDAGGESRLFARGIRAELVTRLSRIRGLDVISTASVDRYLQADLRLQALADSVGAEWILTGDIQETGDTVRVFAHLVDSRTGANEWTETVGRDRSGDHLFGIQRDLTRRIVESLQRVELSSAEEQRLASPPTGSASAYELYLQARGLTYPRAPSEQSANRAVRLYRRALRLDSTFAPAWAGLADAYAERIWRFGYPRSWADSGVAVARRAIRFDPRLPDAYAQLGDNLGTLGRTGDQLDAYRKALRIRPGYVHVLGNLAAVHAGAGRLAEAMRWLDRASVPSSTPPAMLRRLVLENARLGREDAVDGWMRYARTLGYELPWASFNVRLYFREDTAGARSELAAIDRGQQVEPEYQRASLALYRHDWEAAVRHYRRVLSSRWRGRALYLLGPRAGLAYALDRLGRDDAARQAARVAIDSAGSRLRLWAPPSGLLQRAVARLVLGDTTRALDRIEEAADDGFLDVRVARTAPTLDPLSDHPRFRALVGRMDSALATQRAKVNEEGWGRPPDGRPPGNEGPQ